MTTSNQFVDEKCDNCSAICDKAINHEGRWFYECHTFTGGLRKYNDISIIYRPKDNFWQVHAGTAKGYIDMLLPSSSIGDHDYYGMIDYQSTSSDSVCIDPDATAIDSPGYEDYFDEALNSGSLECLDGQDWVLLFGNVFD